jgi:hypothetical protein
VPCLFHNRPDSTLVPTHVEQVLTQPQPHIQPQKSKDPPPYSPEDFDFSIQKKKGKSDFSQADFDARDLWLRAKAWEKLEQIESVCVGNMPAWLRDTRKRIEWICQEAGLTIARYFELDKLQKKWPENAPDWAKERDENAEHDDCAVTGAFA